MRCCALFLLIALALALLAVGAQAQERGDAAGDPPATPRISRLSWSGLTIRAEWNPVVRATGYDLRWTPEEQRRRHLTVSAERAVDGSPAEVSALWAGRWRVEVRARIGSGPSAVRGEWSRPRILRVYDAPPRLEVERFDGEYALLNWTGVGASYELEWGERGGAKQFARRDGRSPTLELGPLEAGKTYEFRVRARDGAGRSGYSPTAVFTPTGWRGGRPGAGYVGRIGQIYALWFPQRGAEWYELSWINAADPTETARVRVGTATSGGSRPQVPGQIGREGGFENGTWNVRVRAGPRGVWSPLYPLTLSNQPERLALELESSRELCTAGTLTEIMWKISGGSAPYALRVENSAVDVSADNARINCGALSEAEAADEDAALAAKRITATVTDARGVRRQAALDVARARALPAPANVRYYAGVADVSVFWDAVGGAGSQSQTMVDPVSEDRLRVSGVVRTRADRTNAAWSYQVIDHISRTETVLDPPLGLSVLSVAAVRHALEVETPHALNWSGELVYAATKPAQNVTLTATHDTVTVSWDRQPYAASQPSIIWLYKANDVWRGHEGSRQRLVNVQRGVSGRHEVTFQHLPVNTALVVGIDMNDATGPPGSVTLHPVRTQPAPPGWTAWPAGPQNLRHVVTNGVVTVLWDEPYSNAEPRWSVTITDTATGRAHHTWSHSTSWTWPSHVNQLPNHAYRVTVQHRDIQGGSAEITITTPADPGASAASTGDASPDEMPLSSFFPIWPVMVDERYAMTDDPFQWRTASGVHRYHGGLDIGEYSRDAYCIGETPTDPSCIYSYTVKGDAVYAATDGILRVVADDLPSSSVMHCPSDDALHKQFYVHPGSGGSQWSNKIKSHPSHKDHPSHSSYVGDARIYCENAVNPVGGRTALVAYERDDSSQIVTKYGHLLKDGFPRSIVRALASNFTACDPALPVREPCKLDPNKTMAVQQGQHIASVGNSGNRNENDGFDAHVHFEIWHFDIPPDQRTSFRPPWYRGDGAGSNCKPPQRSETDCVWWPGHGPRVSQSRPILDVEAYLPPLPASPAPTAAREVYGTLRPKPGQSLVDLKNADVVHAHSSVQLVANLAVAFWRPLFYAQYYSNPANADGERGQISRAGTAGIASTGPGVDAYYTHIVCEDSSAATHSGPHEGSATSEGEIARAHLTGVSLTLSVPCTLTVRSSNKHWEQRSLDLVRDRTAQNINLEDPAATVTWRAKLSAGVDVIRVGESLIGDDLDLFTFTAHRGDTYRFCTYPTSQPTDDCRVS